MNSEKETLNQKELKEIIDGQQTKVRVRNRGRMRNKPCLCGSGEKFKKCCWDKTV